MRDLECHELPCECEWDYVTVASLISETKIRLLLRFCLTLNYNNLLLCKLPQYLKIKSQYVSKYEMSLL
jgi:hypothetical protein